MIWQVMMKIAGKLCLSKSLGYDVEYVLKGMGEFGSIQQLFVAHATEALLDEDL